ncbi:DsbA family protein [Saccharothrix coeruleofusca]|uniref:Membrane protein n=1 Tax=Saccharothrix coeruleofusca TaxID=33919 RepID=A0A918AI57_9PSEU|nr:thioredoxin domain-containing protein [Saccharothrix coeruleofusca]MBP2333876.1 protein-disulfide isomerase [Saccharothrix coeruleofusca]GGP45042.1 membrane protein [Saccharothrix coeruleofusca]
MGGAERNARKKKQQQRAAKAVTGARAAGGDRTKIIAGVVVVAVLALAVVGGVIWTGASKDEPKLTPQQAQSISAPVQREEGVVVVGKDDAKVTIDIYEDFICPGCGSFEEAYHGQIKERIEAGTLKARYHMLPMLNRMSEPQGYSGLSANAALCAADQGKFWEYHSSLFAAQPEEGGPGYTKEELVKLGTDLGITSEEFKTCVDTGKHDALATAELDKAKQTSFFEGTPTVTVGDQPVDVSNRGWLDDLLK